MPSPTSSLALPRRTSPLRVHFVLTSLPVGGAETLLLNLIRKLDRRAFSPEVVCLKQAGALGEEIGQQVPLHSRLLSGKWDLRVLWRLRKLFRGSDAVITVGAGDKMFWGRLAAKLADVPVICSALHSTGWPDGVGRLNRLLTPITDGFIACAKPHAQHLARVEGFPPSRVFTIPNGVDTDRFRPNHPQRGRIRAALDLPSDCPLVGIVAALRPEKNHAQFVEAAREVLRHHPQTHFLIVGEGPERGAIHDLLSEYGLTSRVHLLGSRYDTENLLAAMDVFCLTSRNEANPVSILEALSSGVPVVAPDVGSIRETVIPKRTGVLTSPLCAASTADGIVQLLSNRSRASNLGLEGRQLVRHASSLLTMVEGYENLLENLYNAKAKERGRPLWTHVRPCVDSGPLADDRPGSQVAPLPLDVVLPPSLSALQSLPGE
ncbi:MAG: glycosyltransferase [Planctomycetales bacterium]|nr:glycosyltransferase [Planctomycetales bacterium]